MKDISITYTSNHPAGKQAIAGSVEVFQKGHLKVVQSHLKVSGVKIVLVKAERVLL